MINEMQGVQNSGLGIFCVFLAYLIAMLFAITFHEFAHAYIAHKCGDDTAKYMGRMTLNPFKHMDFLGAIMFIFSALVGQNLFLSIQINSETTKKACFGCLLRGLLQT